mgnify:FL=1|tara:strand:+ start:2023 stop:2955 length:933 start_codon:yes stop_codon:yes gene_type:complete
MMNFTRQQPQQRLSDANEAHLYALAQQGNGGLSHAALMEQASAQQQMQAVAGEQNLQVPKVNFYPSRHPDPHKARRKDIKQAYKLLMPSRRSIFNPVRLFLGRKYRYNKQTHVCVVDGCDCATLIQYDNLYAKITDEDSGRNLWEMYWRNPVTGEAEAFIAKDKVTNGRKMRGTYCPEHLHLYHLLCKWETEEDKVRENNPRRLRDHVKRGVSVVTVPVAAITKKDPTPPMLEKYEPFFDELMRDSKKTNGISLIHYKNPVSQQNDVTMVIFDLRIFEHEMAMMKQPTQAFQNMMGNQNPIEQETHGSIE